MITNQTSRKLKKQVRIFLATQAMLKAKAAEFEQLKAQLAKDLDAVLAEFDNGVLTVPGVAVVKIALNPAKLVWAKDGKSLTPAERDAIAPDLPDSYLFEDINVKVLKDAIDRGDKTLVASLKKKGVVCEQGSRYDVKVA